MKLHPGDLLLRIASAHAGQIRDRVLEHVSGCPRCLARLAELSPSYDLALTRAERCFERRQNLLARERAEAPGLLSILKGLPSGRRTLLLRNSSRFRSWGLLELLIRAGQEETFHDTRHSEELLQLALEVLKTLDIDYYGGSLLEDMYARVWGYIANAHRARKDLGRAESLFNVAFEHLAQGTGEPMERALLLDLKASLCREQNSYEEALNLSQRAIAAFRKLGERHRMGRCMVNQAIAYRFWGDPNKAVSLLASALPLIDQDREPRLALCIWNNMAENLVTAGRVMEAQKALAKANRLYPRFPETLVQVRRLWAEAKVAHALGQHEKAEELLERATAGVLQAGTAYDRELLSQDLASVRSRVSL